MKPSLCLALALGLSWAGYAKELQQLNNGIRVTPIKVAPAKMVDGQVVFGEWQNYSEPVAGCFGAEHWDGFDPDSTGFPEDEDGCGLGSARWFFGPSYCNGAATNDMNDATAGAQSTFTNFSWYWYCGGSGSEQCIIAVFTGEDFTTGCGGFGGFYSGVGYDFGSIGCNPGGYYYTNVDLTGSGLFHQMPNDGDGVYQVIYLTTGNAPATCAQPMLWGNGAGRPGTSGEEQWDDDNPRDSAYQAEECYSYAYGLCPDPLGASQSFGDGTDNCGGGCDAVITKVKARVKDGRCTVKVKGTDPTPGDTFTVTNNRTGESKSVTANDRNKWKTKFKNAGCNGGTVTACDQTEPYVCNCQLAETGACLLCEDDSGIACLDVATEAECLSLGGEFQGNGTLCPSGHPGPDADVCTGAGKECFFTDATGCVITCEGRCRAESGSCCFGFGFDATCECLSP
ncbi:MAG: hypothetical protein KJ057_04050 [Phycisphaerae bacterium]|nr:hypothetical protein [Planctomycetia bacterium]MCL4717628.1 hypothetical protein [Phycisphaerae bacterium]